jgi:dTMP kinase
MVILLDVKVSDSFSRKKQRRDKFEKNKTFALKIADTYRKLAKKYGWYIVNASQSKDQVHQEVQKTILKHMK